MKWSEIAKYLSGETDRSEKEKMEKWIRKDPKNKQLVDNLSIFLKNNKMENRSQNINVEKAWEQLKNRIEESGETADYAKVISLRRSLLKYAAIILIFIGIGSLGYFAYYKINQSMNYVSIETKQFEKKNNLYLPDGSIAALNGNSKIHYPKEFNTEERTVAVIGEAFFDVEKNPEKPFVIKANKAKIKVLGTSFNVRTDLPDDAVEVYVKSGKVKFYKANDESRSIIIEPGYVGLLINNKLQKKKNNDINYLSWKTGKLLFKDTEMQKVVQKLNHTYNVNIKIPESELKDLKLSASFSNEPIEKVLNVITRTFNLELVKKGNNEYILRINKPM